jgi:hypothetical protein
MSFKDRSLHVTRPLLRAARHPLHCIVPPHMLKEIVERGDTAQKEWGAGNTCGVGQDPR